MEFEAFVVKVDNYILIYIYKYINILIYIYKLMIEENSENILDLG